MTVALDRAERAAEAIADLRPGAAVCLFGSVARESGSGRPGDVDILVVEVPPVSRPTVVLSHLDAPEPDEPPLNVLTYSPHEIERLWTNGSLFAVHLMREGRILRDPLSLLSPWLDKEPLLDFVAAARRELARLDPYREPRRFNGNLTSCFAQTYSVGRSIVMLLLAKRGIWEFDRQACFTQLAATESRYRSDVEFLASLEPFDAWRRRRGERDLPFSPHLDDNPEATTKLRDGLAALDRLASDLSA